MKIQGMTPFDAEVTRRRFLRTLTLLTAGTWAGFNRSAQSEEDVPLSDLSEGAKPSSAAAEIVTNRVVIPLEPYEFDGEVYDDRLEGVTSGPPYVYLSEEGSPLVRITEVMASGEDAPHDESDPVQRRGVRVSIHYRTRLDNEDDFYLAYLTVDVLGPSGTVLRSAGRRADVPILSAHAGGFSVSRPSLAFVFSELAIEKTASIAIQIDPRQSKLLAAEEFIEMQRNHPYYQRLLEDYKESKKYPPQPSD